MSDNSFKVGKKDGFNVDFNKLVGGIKKEDLKNFESIFGNLDADGNGALDRKELLKLKEMLSGVDKNKNGELSDCELKKFKFNDEKVDKELLKAFLGKLNEMTKGIDNVQDVDDYTIVNYSDGKEEAIYPNGARFVKYQEGNDIIKEEYNGEILKEKVTDNGKENKRVVYNGENKQYEIIQNKENKSITEIWYDKNGKQNYKVVTDGNIVKTYDNGDKLTQTTNISTGEVTKYGEDGTSTTTVKGEDGATTQTIKNGDNVVKEIKTNTISGKNLKIETTYNETGAVEDTFIDNIKAKQVVKDENGNVIAEANYDENGNTKGVIVPPSSWKPIADVLVTPI